MRARKLFYVVAYDIEDDKKRNKVSKMLEKYGTRINYSVFECMFTEKQLATLQDKVGRLIYRGGDTVVYYPCCVNCYTKIVYQPDRQQKTEVVLMK